MAYPYTIKVDKNKITLGMMRRAVKNELDAVVDIIAALSVDADGNKVPREAALAAVDEMTLAEIETIAEQLQDAYTPKAN